MPLTIEGKQPSHAGNTRRMPRRLEHHPLGEQSLRIAFINNMPDAALEDTERQFFSLLGHAAGNLHVRVKAFSLPEVPRGERGGRYISDHYSSLEALFLDRFDGLIITGTEPKHPNLRDEPYWSSLCSVLAWAELNTSSTILSCLAAHAGVLYSDDIKRTRLPQKRFGVFPFATTAHPLAAGLESRIHFPHSRWNEVPKHRLVAAGYSLITESDQGEVDTFARLNKKSLFIYFQGHPEYSPQSLFKEYRRDVLRFVRGERTTYPAIPNDYFDKLSSDAFLGFQELMTANPREEIMAAFPACPGTTDLNSWLTSAQLLYCNWIQYIHSLGTADRSAYPVSDQHQGPFSGAHTFA